LMEEALNLRGDIITCVPLHPIRRRERGYNQSELIAKRLSELTSIPYSPLLIKIRNTPPQSTLKSHAERLDNIHGAFQLKDDPDLSGKHILLADDVFTTGATAEECTALLKSAGAASVRVITFSKGGTSWLPQEPC
ncbi:MAG: ComF family protein, partial [Christensenellaceae bacterium]|nr:ComF family protein [Christensenellaceae bacterium]